jgi:hypothetical protein
MGKRASPRKKSSARVTRESHALTLDKGVFSQRSRKTLEAAKGEPCRLFGKQKSLKPDPCQIDD